jgi:heme/copper-type cytochrome/quinol oxidase subunit 1
MSGRYTLAGAHIGVAIGAFGVAAAMGLLQALSLAEIHFPFRSESLYYISVTANGVLMALVFTTFFIMGLGYVLAQENLGRIRGGGAAWFAFWLAAIGSITAAVTVLAGKSTVLYTFYPPLQAHPLFYIGATMLVLGSWIWGGVMIASYRSWHRENAGVPIPLAIHGMLADHHLVSGDSGAGDRSSHYADPVVTALDENDRPAAGADLFLVVRTSTGLFLADSRLRDLVHSVAARCRRQTLQ